MNISTCAAIVVTVLDVLVGVRYCIKLFRRQIAPRAATWLIFEIGVVMSLITYAASRDHSFVKASLNTADSFVVTFILLAILLQQKGQGIRFTANERICLVASCIAAIVWALTRAGWIGFVGFQFVMSIAYLPMIESMWRWKPGPSPEPLDKWSVNILIAFIGVLVAVTGRHDYLAMIYPLRALVLCVITVVLILRWKYKSREVPQTAVV